MGNLHWLVVFLIANTRVLSLITCVTVKMYLMWLWVVSVCKNMWLPLSQCDLTRARSWPGGCPVKVVWFTFLLNRCVPENLGKTDLPDTLPSGIPQQPVCLAVWVVSVTAARYITLISAFQSSLPSACSSRSSSVLDCSSNNFESKIPSEMLERLLILMMMIK